MAQEEYYVQTCSSCRSIVLLKHLHTCSTCGQPACDFCSYRPNKWSFLCEKCYNSLPEDQKQGIARKPKGGLTRKRALIVLALGIFVLIMVLQPFVDFVIALFTGTFDSYAFVYALPAIILIVLGAILVKRAPKSK